MTISTQTSPRHRKVLPCPAWLILDLLDFTTPRGLRLHTASYAAEQFTAAATLSALPILEGSLAYTYTSKPLTGVQGTASSALIDLVQGFRETRLPRAPEDVRDWEIWQAGRRVDFRGTSSPHAD
jgi:distribution and morphology protein 10